MRTLVVLSLLVVGCARTYWLTRDQRHEYEACQQVVQAGRDPGRAAMCKERLAELDRAIDEREQEERRRGQAINQAMQAYYGAKAEYARQAAATEPKTVRCQSTQNGNQIDTVCRETEF